MKPCNCKSMDDVSKMPESGISHNESGLLIVPPNVMITMPRIALKIPMKVFKRFAEWYLEDQK